MTDAELGMELYVVVGNALNLLLRGMDSTGLPGCDLPLASLAQLDAKVGRLGPGEMLHGLQALSAVDRQLLARCCRCGLAVAAGEVDTLLGAQASLVEELALAMERM